MNTDEIKEELLTDAQRLLDNAEKLMAENHRLEQRNKELEEQVRICQGIVRMEQGMSGTWIDYDEHDLDKRPFDGELVVVQVGNCKPYMFTYLHGCRLEINKWLRLPE